MISFVELTLQKGSTTPDRHEICPKKETYAIPSISKTKWSKQTKGDMGYDFFCLKWIAMNMRGWIFGHCAILETSAFGDVIHFCIVVYYSAWWFIIVRSDML